MDEFLSGKTNVSPLTGRLLRPKEADQLRSALRSDPRERVGAFMVRAPDYYTRWSSTRSQRAKRRKAC